jgi:hypothetical protein
MPTGTGAIGVAREFRGNSGSEGAIIPMKWIKGLVPWRRSEGGQAARPARLTNRDMRALMAILNDQSQPNMNALVEATRNLDFLALNVKAMGYELAHQLGKTLRRDPPPEPGMAHLGTKLCTQADIESDWFAYWCDKLRMHPIYHRKLWEFAYLLQVLHETGMLRAGLKGLGFGCGSEPMASYFASLGMRAHITDLPPDDARSAGWAINNEHAPNLLHAHHASLVDRETFLRQVTYQNVDMNDIPADLVGYDFCWSICALEHLGSIKQGLTFIENSLDTLRLGGVAIHTAEFNLNPDGPTIDNWITVLFQRRHIEALAERLERQGHKVAAMNFDPGNGVLDRFIDLPPWHDSTQGMLSAGLGQPLHLKVAADGFACTCIGIVVRKRG